MTACIDCHIQTCGPNTPPVDVERAAEEITRAVARMIYERVTGKSWRLAKPDPGLDPEWRQHAKPIADQIPLPGGQNKDTVH